MIKTNIFSFYLVILLITNKLSFCNQSDSISIARYKKLSDQFINDNIDSSLFYINIAFLIANSINNKYEQAECLNKLGLIYKKAGEYDKCLDNLFKSLAIRKSLGDSAKIGSSFENIGQVYKNIGLKSGDKKTKAENIDTALVYYHKSRKIKEKTGNPEYLGSVYNGLGILYRLRNNLDSSILYYNKTAIIYTVLNDTLKLAKTFSNIGNVYTSRKNYSKATEYYKKAEFNYEAVNSIVGLGQVYFNLGSINQAIKNTDLAVEYYQKSIEKFKQANYKEYVDYVFESLSNLYEKNNRYKDALAYYKIYNSYKDSILNEEKVKAIAELEISYKTKEKEQELSLEKEKSARIYSEKKNKELMLYILGSLIILILIIVAYIIRNFRQKQKLNIQEITIKKQEINRLLQEQEIRSYAALLEGQDSERKRIAEDLHDRLGSTLSTVKLHFQSIEKKIDDLKLDSKKQYDVAYNLLDNAVREVREIAHNLSSGILNKFGLGAALKDLKNTIETSNEIKVDLFLEGSRKKLPSGMEIEIYRVIQELVSNVLKHAGASEIILQLNYLDDNLNITFQDNGIGFNTDKAHEGMGLKNIKARISKYEGGLHVDSGKGNGTTIIIDLPI